MHCTLHIRVVTFLLLITIVNTAISYDPYWSMKGETIATETNYRQDKIFSYMTSWKKNADSKWKALITLPYKTNVYYEFTNSPDAYDKTKMLISDIYNNNLTIENVQDFRSSIRYLAGIGVIASGGLMTNGLIPEVAIYLPSLNGVLTFEYQGNTRPVPSAFTISFTEDDLLTQQSSCENLIDSRLQQGGNNPQLLQNCFNELSDEQKRLVCTDPDLPASCDIGGSSSIFSLASSLASVNLRGASRYNNYIFGYSTEAWRYRDTTKWTTGRLFVGGKLSYTDVDTGFTSLKLTEFTKKQTVPDLLGKIIDEKDTLNSAGFGLDSSITWMSDRYITNLTINNLVAPEIKYLDGSTVKQVIVPSLSAIFYLNKSQSWYIDMQNDFAAMRSVADIEHMWRILGIGYNSNVWYIPGIDISKRWNLAGQKQSYTALGIRILHFAQASIAISDTSVSNIPRAGIFSIGFGFSL